MQLHSMIAMFGIGAHYFIDLVVGFALANCVGGLAAFRLSWWGSARWQAILAGALLCLSWYVMILYGLFFLQSSKALAWCVFLGSIALSIRLEWNLVREQSLHLNNAIKSKESSLTDLLTF